MFETRRQVGGGRDLPTAPSRVIVRALQRENGPDLGGMATRGKQRIQLQPQARHHFLPSSPPSFTEMRPTKDLMFWKHWLIPSRSLGEGSERFLFQADPRKPRALTHTLLSLPTLPMPTVPPHLQLLQHSFSLSIPHD